MVSAPGERVGFFIESAGSKAPGWEGMPGFEMAFNAFGPFALGFMIFNKSQSGED